MNQNNQQAGVRGKQSTTKHIEWSYATSTNATKFGFGKVGCYTVELKPDVHTPAKAVAGFKTIAEAESFAESLVVPWDRLTRRMATENK